MLPVGTTSSFLKMAISRNIFVCCLKELRELLASLNQANEMACRLKQRSEDILTTLQEEMLRIQQPETTGAS